MTFLDFNGLSHFLDKIKTIFLPISSKGAANGVASLDSSGKLVSSQLPDIADDVLEYASLSAFPATGEAGKIYIDKSDNSMYRWDTSEYVKLADEASGSLYADLCFNIQPSDWTLSNDVYTYTYTHSTITVTCATEVELLKGAREALAGSDLDSEKVINNGSASVVFTVSHLPTAALPICLRVIDAPAADIVYPISDTLISTNTVSGENTVNGALASINTAISGKADKVSSATSGNFAALDSNGNLTDSGHKHSDYLTSHQDISGKADVVSNAISGNFAALNSNGNLTDSGHADGDYARKTDTVLDTTLSLGRKANTTAGTGSIALGLTVEASGIYSQAFGGYTKASNIYAHTEGFNTIASGQYAHAEGYQTYAEGTGSHAEGGANTKASGDYSHAEGLNTYARGRNSHSEGYMTQANGNRSHSEGESTEAYGYCSHVGGYNTVAYGDHIHASGKYNVRDAAVSNWTAGTSYAVGDKVIYQNKFYICKTANSDETFTSSKWDTAFSSYAEIVGNGTNDSNRSNARVLDWDGNERIKGDLFINCNADSSGGISIAGKWENQGSSTYPVSSLEDLPNHGSGHVVLDASISPTGELASYTYTKYGSNGRYVVILTQVKSALTVTPPTYIGEVYDGSFKGWRKILYSAINEGKTFDQLFSSLDSNEIGFEVINKANGSAFDNSTSHAVIFKSSSSYASVFSFTGASESIFYKYLNNGTWSDWLKIAFDKDVAHLTGNETIAGTKTFSSSPKFNVNSVYMDNSTINVKTSNNNISSNVNMIYYARDKNAIGMGCYEINAYKNGEIGAWYGVRNYGGSNYATDLGWSGMEIKKDKSNNITWTVDGKDKFRDAIDGGKFGLKCYTGTGTAGQAGSASAAYVPSLWTFNTGLTPAEGDIITIKIPVAGVNSGIWMSVDNGTTYYPVSISGTTRCTTQYPVSDTISLIYQTSRSTGVYGTTQAGGAAGSSVANITTDRWQVLNYANTTYSALSAADATTGTSTTARLITAKVLHDKVNGVTTDSTVANIATAASDCTVSAASVAINNKVMTCALTVKKTTAVTGSTTTTTLCTMASGKRPKVQASGTNGWNKTCVIETGGQVKVYGTITANETLYLRFTYVLA